MPIGAVNRLLSSAVFILCPARYADADLAVLAPTAGESFGIAILEAFLSGRACVATDVGGVKEMVLDGQTGCLVPPGDTDAIADAIVQCLGDDARRNEMAAAGKARCLSRFTPRHLGDTAEALFERLAKEVSSR